MAAKMSVRADPDPLWADLAAQPEGGPPQWNFTKDLVGADGKLVRRWGTKTKPEDPDTGARAATVPSTPWSPTRWPPRWARTSWSRTWCARATAC